jgi:hypothetical protein
VSSALENHVWGVSRGADRVWAQVTGLLPSLVASRRLIVFQAFVDESAPKNRHRGDWFVMAAVVAHTQKWAEFAVEWERLLPWAPLNKEGVRRFKLAEMGSGEEAGRRILCFFRVLEAHAPTTVYVAFRLSDLEKAKARIVLPGVNIDWQFVGSPYATAFHSILYALHTHRDQLAEFVPLDQKVEFIFDKLDQSKLIARQWDNYVETSDEQVRPFLPTTPRFENEEEFLPLQGADLMAGLIRRSLEGADFDPLSGQSSKADASIMRIDIDEDTMVKNLIRTLSHGRPGDVIYDLDAGVPRPWENSV